MRVVVVLGVVFLVMTTGIPAQALVPWVLYDDFNAPLINPNKWFGTESGGIGSNAPGLGTEAHRFVEGGRLRMEYRSYGDITSDVEETNSPLSLRFVNPAAVTAIKTTVLVRRYTLTACPTNFTLPTRTRARLVGVFFNAGAPAAPGDFTNEVIGQIRVQRRVDSTDPPNIFRVQGAVFRCDNADCSAETDLPTVTLGDLTINTHGTIAIQWDQPNHQFIFTFDATQAAIPYPWPDTAPPANPQKRVDVTNGVANCTSLPRPMAFIDASFDDVYVNQ